MPPLECTLCLLVETHLAGEREQDPAADVLHQLATADLLRRHRYDVGGVFVGRCPICAEIKFRGFAYCQ